MEEAIPDAAIRETFEETGYRSTILELPTPSLAPGAANEKLNKEPIAITMKVDRISRPDHSPVQKFIFWWVSEVDLDEDGAPVERVEGTQMPYEDYEVCEMSIDESLKEDGLTFEEDRRVVQMAKNLLGRRHQLFLEG